MGKFVYSLKNLNLEVLLLGGCVDSTIFLVFTEVSGVLASLYWELHSFGSDYSRGGGYEIVAKKLYF